MTDWNLCSDVSEIRSFGIPNCSSVGWKSQRFEPCASQAVPIQRHCCSARQIRLQVRQTRSTRLAEKLPPDRGLSSKPAEHRDCATGRFMPVSQRLQLRSLFVGLHTAVLHTSLTPAADTAMFSTL